MHEFVTLSCKIENTINSLIMQGTAGGKCRSATEKGEFEMLGSKRSAGWHKEPRYVGDSLDIAAASMSSGGLTSEG